MLPYKARRGRAIDTRKAAFGKLVAALEELASATPRFDVKASPRWEHLRSVVGSTKSPSTLDTAEDELDAYVCAYVGLYYLEHGVSHCRVVGNLERGYIVTPVNEADGERIDRIRAAMQIATA